MLTSKKTLSFIGDALVLDNATCHPADIVLSNIKLVFLPPNTTSHTQPMDKGIIANFKRHYRFLFTMGHVIPAVEAGKKLQFDVLKALKLSVQAWDMVTPRTVSRCFRRAGFVNPAVEVLTPEEEAEEELPLSELVQRLNSAGHTNEIGRPFTVDSLEHVLTVDEGLQTTGQLTDNEIVQDVLEPHVSDDTDMDAVSDEEIETVASTKPSTQEFQQFLEGAERFLSYEHSPESEIMYFQILQMQAWAIRRQPSRTQTRIDNFFKPANNV